MAKVFQVIVSDFGDGFEQRGLKNQAYLHGDGRGGVVSHKGNWQFDIKLNGLNQGNNDPRQEMNQAWQFISDRLGPFESFYFYNPVETDGAIDPTGISTVGRYLVRLKDPPATFEAFAMHLHRGQLAFVEVRA